MLNLLVGVRIAGVRAKALHPRIGYTVKENYRRLDKFRGDRLTRGRAVPCPTQFGERSEETGKTDETITPENATLYTKRVR